MNKKITQVSAEARNGLLANGKDNTTLDEDTSCSLRLPSWIHALVDIRLFVVCHAVICLCTGIVFAYMVSTVTTIEKRFHLHSKQSGFWLSAFEITNMPATLITGYFGSRLHAPRVLAFSCLFSAVFCIFGAVPHFIYGEGNDASYSRGQNSSQDSLCSADHTSISDTCGDADRAVTDSNSTAYGIFLVVTMGLGLVLSTVSTLGLPYLDNNCDKYQAAHYIGIIYSMYGVGPLMGFMLGAGAIGMHITLQDTTISQRDPRWIGAYWFGFVICSAAFLLPVLPYLLFPRKLPVKRKNEDADNEHTDVSVKQDIVASTMSLSKLNQPSITEGMKDIPKVLRRLFTNVVYDCLLLAAIFETYVGLGMFSFMPKYIEEQFGQSGSMANIMSGVIACGAASVGVYTGGILVSKLKLDRAATARMVVLCGTASLACLVALTFVGCDTGKANSLLQSSIGDKCSCGCSSDQFNPVCTDNTTYLSPCHAGCTSSSILNETQVFLNCTCLSNGTNDSSATMGICSTSITPCDWQMVVYLAFLFVSALVGGLSGVAGVMIMLRSIRPEDKSFALGLKSTVAGLFASIPGPVLFGSLVDSACLVWQTTPCDDGSKNCRAYNPDLFRTYLWGVGAAFKFVTVGLYCIIWYKCSKYKENDKHSEHSDKNGKPEEFLLDVKNIEHALNNSKTTDL